jgi:hypothetical protein
VAHDLHCSVGFQYDILPKFLASRREDGLFCTVDFLHHGDGILLLSRAAVSAIQEPWTLSRAAKRESNHGQFKFVIKSRLYSQIKRLSARVPLSLLQQQHLVIFSTSKNTFSKFGKSSPIQ